MATDTAHGEGRIAWKLAVQALEAGAGSPAKAREYLMTTWRRAPLDHLEQRVRDRALDILQGERTHV
jgi:hypothetical protein